MVDSKDVEKELKGAVDDFDKVVEGDKEKCKVCGKKVGADIIEASESVFHKECFKCVKCETGLISKVFYTLKSGIHCEACYEKSLKVCVSCDKKITDKVITYNEKFYHVSCFLCHECKEPLDGRRFTKEGETFTCSDCYTKTKDLVCEVCKKNIDATDEKIKVLLFEGKRFHFECFNCHECKKNLSDSKEGIMIKDGNICCKECF